MPRTTTTARPSTAPARSPAAKTVPADPSDLLDMEQAIAALATTRPTFYRWLRAGSVKGVKLGRQWRFRREDIERFLRGEGPRIDLPADIKPLIANLRQRLGERAKADAGDALESVVKLCVQLAAHLQASNLHLLALATTGALQLRIDGALLEIARFDPRLLPLLVERFKRMTGIDVANVSQVQDGRLRYRLEGQVFDVLATSVPASHGECLFLSFHDQSLALPALDALQFATREQALLQRTLATGSGMILFAGPTGSGKSTTLYACAAHTMQPSVRLVSVESSMPYSLSDAIRVRVGTEQGMDYPSALRAVVRMDPDIIVIDQLRDRDACEGAVECSMTGHLVLACLHAPDAITALRRIADLCVDLDAGLEEVAVVVAQRMVRRLCSACAASAHPGSALVRRAELVAGAGGVPWSALKPSWKQATGCTACRDSGYAGRFMITEVLEVTRELRIGLRRGATDQELRSIALHQGFVTLAADGIRKAAQGLTTIEDLQRALPAMAAADT